MGPGNERSTHGVDGQGEIGQGRETFVILPQEFYISVTIVKI